MALVKFTRRSPRVAFQSPMFGFPTLDDVESRMNKFIEQAFREPFTAMATPESIGLVPAMDLVESDKEFMLTAELAGMDQKDVEVNVVDGVLTISGEKNEEKEQEDRKVYLYERSYGSFQRSFALPAGVDAAKVTAEFTKGVLKVHLPKNGGAPPKGIKVDVKSA